MREIQGKKDNNKDTEIVEREVKLGRKRDKFRKRWMVKERERETKIERDRERWRRWTKKETSKEDREIDR